MKSTTARNTDRQLRAYAQLHDYQFLDTNLPGTLKAINPKGRPYLTTVSTCTCPDGRPGTHRCKHQYMVEWVLSLEQPAPARPAPVAPTSPQPGSPEWRQLIAHRRAQDFPAD